MDLAFKHWKSKRENSPITAAAPSSEPPKLVLLHGMGGTGALWRPVAASLEEDFEILAPDQRGHGGSRLSPVPGGRVPDGYSPLDYGRDVVDLLRKMNFYPTWIVGHSMGVRTACAVAHLYPEGIQGLVLIDLGFSGVAGGGLGEGLAAFLKLLPVTFPTKEAARQFMAANCPDPAIGQYLLAVSTPVPGDGGITFPFDQAALIQTIHAARDSSVRTWVRELGLRQMPILVLRGETSTVWTREEMEEERENFRDLPSVHFEEFQGTGHGLPFEKRSQFVARLREFVARFSAGAGAEN